MEKVMRKTMMAVAIAAVVAFGFLSLAPVSAAGFQKEEKVKEEKTKTKKAKKSDKKSDETVAADAEPEKSSKKSGKKADKASKKSLYARLVGKNAITAVVDEFVGIVANDARINSFFADAAKDPQRLAAFKMKLVDQICQGTGGPCKYRGKDMKTAHTGMNITEEHFNALVEDLVAALNKFNVPEAEKNELLAILGPMKADIVGQ
jgi:hemoglobin